MPLQSPINKSNAFGLLTRKLSNLSILKVDILKFLFFLILISLCLPTEAGTHKIRTAANHLFTDTTDTITNKNNNAHLNREQLQIPPDSIIKKGFVEAINLFDQTFLFTDFRGNYNQNYEQLFSELLVDDIMIFNFLPGTDNHEKNISLDEYTVNISNVAQNLIIQAGLHHYNISDILHDRNNNAITAHVKYYNDIVIYTMQYDRIAAFDLHLNIHVQFDYIAEEIKILRIDKSEPSTLSLEFIVTNANRLPLSNVTVEFEYASKANGQTIKRKRNTNEEGWVQISMLPPGATLMLNAPKRYSFPEARELTIEEWIDFFSTNTLVIERAKLNYLPARVRLGSYFRMPVSNYQLLRSGFDFQTTGQHLEVIPAPGFFIHFAYSVFNKNQYSLFLGSGIEYNIEKINIETETIYQVFNDMPLQHTDNFNLNIFARGVKDSYTHRSFAVPLIVTNRYELNYRRINAIDLTTKAAWYFSRTTSYTSRVRNQRIKPAFDQNHNINVNVNHSGLDLQPKEISMSGEIEQPAVFSLDLQLALDILIYQEFSMQPIISYSLLFFGGDHNEYKPRPDHTFAYNQSLGYQRYLIGNITAGLAIIYNF